MALALLMEACFAQGDFNLDDSALDHGVTINAPANWYTGTFSAEVWELNAHSIPANLKTVASLSPISAYALLWSGGFQLEQTFVNQTCSDGTISLGEIDMWGAWENTTVVIVLAAWNTAAPNWRAMLAEADSNTRAGVVAWTQTTGFVGDSLGWVPGTDAWSQDLVLTPVASSPVSLPVGEQAQDFTYITNNGAITITQYTGPGGAVTIPDSINGLPVTSIGNFAFYTQSALTSISIPDNVTSIGYEAFLGCFGLSAIAVDAANPTYGSLDGVLFDKSQTTLIRCPGGKAGSYTIPDTVSTIAEQAFALCLGLSNVIISDSVTNIGDWAFNLCTGLTNVAMGSSVASIGDDAFYDCTGLAAITIPDSVNSIGSNAFNYCTGLTGARIGNGVTNIGDSGFAYCSSLASIVMGNRLTGIGDNAFYACSGLADVSVPNSVVSIGDSAFGYCSSLTNVRIPNTATSIGKEAFVFCARLTGITVDPSNFAYSSVAGVLFDKSQTTLVACPEGKTGVYTIPDSVTHIGSWAFGYCSNLTAITIPDSVNSIGTNAFGYCTRLTSVELGNGVTSIGGSAFGSCYRLTSLTIPDSVTSIGDGAFVYCGSLTSLTIPDNVTSVGVGAFFDCTGLTSVTVGTGVTSIGESAFWGCPSLNGVYFRGNAPSSATDTSVFTGDGIATVYYLPGTTGWGPTFGGRPTVLWNPQVQPGSLGVRNNQFGFTITGTSNLVVVVEASTNLANPTWSPLGTNTLSSGSAYFSDPQWTNYPTRFYRLRWP